MSSIENLDLDNLSIDDIEDLPEFGAWPAGSYTALATMERKTVANHPCVELSLKLQNAEALNNPAEEAPREGSETSILFMLDNEFGLGSFKKVAKIARDYFGCGSGINDIVANVNAATVVITLTAKNDKNGTLRNNVREIVFA